MPSAKSHLFKAAAPVARALRLQAGIVLCLHAVRDDFVDGYLAPRDRIGMRPAMLDSLVTGFLDRGYDFVTPDEALRRGGARGERPFVVLTFDDGYVDMAETVLPMLATREIPFTVFVTTGFVDGSAAMWWEGIGALVAGREVVRLPTGDLPCGTREEKAGSYEQIARLLLASSPAAQEALLGEILDLNLLPAARARMRRAPMAWADLRALAGSGLVTIGGHTVSHPVFRNLDDAGAEREVAGTMERLTAELGEAPRHFAYPFGGPEQVGPRDRALVRDGGFATGFGTENGLMRRAEVLDHYRLPRLPYDARFEDVALLEAYATGLPAVLRAGATALRGRPAPDRDADSR